MSAPRIPAEVLHAAQSAAGPSLRRKRRPSLRARVTARINAHAYDRQLSVGARPEPGSPLSAHRDRIVSPKERHAVADTLRQVVDCAVVATVSLRIPLNDADILASADLIDRIAQHLESVDPVGERGIARLRLLLADGRGPLYLHGRGDIRGRLGAALDAL
jgi:hypothetical protein